MGFGTLFIGYFLLLNIFNYAYTDLISALIMALGAYKLSSVCPDFKRAFYLTLPLSLIGLYELVTVFLDLFGAPINNDVLTGVIGIIRCAILGAIGFILLSGIKKLSEEVELPRLLDKAKSARIYIIIAYSVSLILEIPSLDKIIAPKALAVIALLTLIFTFFAIIYTLTAIYSAYMRICMPDQLVREEKKSRFSAVNKFRENEKKRGEEYASYKIEKFNEKTTKKGKK